MVDTTITQLPTATAAASADVFPIVQGGVTKQLTNALLFTSPTFTGTAAFANINTSAAAIVGTNLTVGGATALASLSYTTTLTGGTGIVNLGAGQFYKDTAGNIGLGTTTPASKLDVAGAISVSGKQAVNGPAFGAYAASAQTLSSANVYTKILLQTKEFDTNSNFDNATNYRFTPTVAGYYQINGGTQATSNTLNLITALYKNGVLYRLGSFVGLTSAAGACSNVSSVVYLNGTTDYVELWCATGTASTTLAAGSTTYLNGAMIRGA